MSVAIVKTRALNALDAPEVTIEVHLSNGLPAFTLVGLPETCVKEAKDRVRSAILNSHFDFPQHRITINLAPADLPKEGGRFDLAIAIGILAASEQIPAAALSDFEFLGELALTGAIRPVKGALISASACKTVNRVLILPKDNGAEAALAVGDNHLVADSLLSISAFLHGKNPLTPAPQPQLNTSALPAQDLANVKGQSRAKRALEIAAAGSHNLLFQGPPGCGKSMLASCLPGILPALSHEQILAQLAIQSITTATLSHHLSMQRPFRAPHHSASPVAIVGGGNPPKPGEISLAHEGVLFLDELPEWNRVVLESLREPLENGHIHIARANATALFPANFQLIAAMNPCPCGYYGDNQRQCHCSLEQIKRYRQKLSGPLLDRIDLHLNLEPTPLSVITTLSESQSIPSNTVKTRVAKAYQKQFTRQNSANSDLSGQYILEKGLLSEAAKTCFTQSGEKLKLSARAIQRLFKVALTIADLEDKPYIERKHALEALSFRQSALSTN